MGGGGQPRGADLSDAIGLDLSYALRLHREGLRVQGQVVLKAEGRVCARSSEKQGCLCTSFFCAPCDCCACVLRSAGKQLARILNHHPCPWQWGHHPAP